MVKKILPFLTLILIVGFIVWLVYLKPAENLPVSEKIIQTETVTENPTPEITCKLSKSIFIPSWSIIKDSDFSQYDRLIYFGSENDNGFSDFVELNGSYEKWYTIKMIDTESNIDVLNNPGQWGKISSDTAEIVEKYRLGGIALDLEISSLVLTDLTSKINEFVKHLYTQFSDKKIKFSLVLYGDIFYRKRQYDLLTLNNYCDEVMIMAYDYHKTISESGPNFPLNKGSKYDYDFKQMLADYMSIFPVNKLTVIYGMYGYDWTVSEKKQPLKPARALSLNEIRQQFLDNCQWQNCIVKRDPDAAETEVNYVVSPTEFHIVWFEDEESVRQKTEYLQGKGINSIGYWAEGYF